MILTDKVQFDLLSPPATQIVFPHTSHPAFPLDCTTWTSAQSLWALSHSSSRGWLPGMSYTGRLGIAVSREWEAKTPPYAVRLHSRCGDWTCPLQQDVLGWQEQERLPHLGQAVNPSLFPQQQTPSRSWRAPWPGFNQHLYPHCHAIEKHTQQSMMCRYQQPKGQGLDRQSRAKNTIELFVSLETGVMNSACSR